MKKSKKMLALALAAVVAVTPVLPTYAYEYTGPEGEASDADGDAYGHTTFSVIEAFQDPSNISFEVPLYVTMAVIDGETDVITPSNYSITNTSSKFAEGDVDDDDYFPGYTIGVVGMEFSILGGAKYSTVASGAGTATTDMELSIGGLYMPTLTAGTNDVTAQVDVTSASSPFYSTSNSEYVGLTPSGTTATIDLTIGAKLAKAAELTAIAGAAAQFKIKYTISALSDDNQPIGSVYAGDNKAAAGL